MKIRKTITLDIEVYNESKKKMKTMRIEDFSKYVNHVLRSQSDLEILAGAKAKELFSMAMYYKEVADRVQELKVTI